MNYKQLQTATNNELQTTTNNDLQNNYKQLQTMTYKQLHIQLKIGQHYNPWVTTIKYKM
jgi:hypothetical protein